MPGLICSFLLAAASCGTCVCRTWTTAEGLPENVVSGLSRSQDGYLWIVTSLGVARFDGVRFTTYQSPDIPDVPAVRDMPEDAPRVIAGFRVLSALRTEGGVLWLGTDGGGLVRMRPRAVRMVETPSDGRDVVFVDSTGRTWIGTDADGVRVREPGGRERRFGAADGFPARHVTSFVEDQDGDIWVGTDGMGLWRMSPPRVSYYCRRGERGGEFIRALFCDSEGGIWIGTRGGGVSRLKDGAFTPLPSALEVSSATVSAFCEKPEGRLWLTTEKGLFSLLLNDFARFAAGRTKTCAMDRLDDGARPGAGCRLEPTDGTVGRMASARAPNVVIENPRARVEYEPGVPEVAVDYTADDPGQAEDIVFRTRLLPLESEWSETRSRRVRYANLRHGRYRCEVSARRPFGPWGAVASVAFDVRPRFYERTSFGVVIGLLASLAVFLWLRFVMLRRMRARLLRVRQQNLLADERARIARDIHDDVGAKLTRLSILTAIASEGADRGRAGDVRLAEISDGIRGVTHALDEVVWAVEPRNDSLSGLVDYVYSYTEEYVRTAGLRLRAAFPTELPDVRVTSRVRHAVFMCVKEALNNLVKYAGATTVRATLTSARERVEIRIADDGCGLPPSASGGNGLLNMKARMEGIGGTFAVGMAEGGGCEVTFAFSIGKERQADERSH